MPVITSYEIENDAEFKKKINEAAEKIGDLRLPFTLIAKDWRKSNKAQFSLAGSGLYPPLSKNYSARKKKKNPSAPILVASGRLRDSVTGPLNSDSIQVIKRQSLEIGTLVPYGIYHQSDRPRRKIPLRKFLFIGPESPQAAPSIRTGRLERWVSIIDAEIARKLKAGA
jgi:phage gpG-like protein